MLSRVQCKSNRKRCVLDEQKLSEVYFVQRLTEEKIALLAGCSVDIVRRELRRYGFKGKRSRPGCSTKYDWTEERDLYLISAWDSWVSFEEMKLELGCSEDLIRRRSKQLNLADRRGVSASRSKKVGYKQGFREDLGFWVRSSWEANIARVLKYEQISFQYEPWRLPVDDSTYLPDFLLDSNTILEVKGYPDPVQIEKYHKVELLYPEYQFLLLGPIEYEQVRKAYSEKVDWECPK